MSTVHAILAMGSNLGESRDTLSSAVAELADHPQVVLTAVSPVVRTRPVGGPEQPDYLNLVVAVETGLEPHALLAHCQAVEARHHRERIVRWGPRTLDVDIIAYGDLRLEDEDLTIPHPRAASRAFVLQPWAWMEPDAVLNGVPVAELAAKAEDLPGLEIFEGE
ncbi:MULTISPECIES: 2-amino-4-hydroxy-6-hydroxymethyldihydropteridine diphosphokinase [unclassified Arthrobacter]|uniref:2-amino-4-hydroxy-6- hydroxymethyldihydropteridine diphosphokinase n=1 Tax=unclassified Arthrobacter TaxID=235627 RepID=UPI001D1335C5|nr:MULTISPECIES: 2-amino-4-hydroxy-6-hydroxymethyldihydropteridine diphosphokinase [unclassified Arthrobacter]MCC3275790.1 2-amino-4-hydroxy-6-hydroxymethyldihydropteridine diphosphokinase [Arthrobacter sp. zg-Y20]MCC3278785.1 2-amino-4-hydroxy-6-hydroxymethyldihydropteridine diphosphokinase [Arthrobacter sp. zg-Y40]MCC9177159.1 2-amino-4-hydroxy-6-hydroxymethyldihydropteridine diphosphokinase [Arthrobacter sp. zg-Y750]MDK1315947.1 2-amino-4-hydroxy-6-hydroxymethyldihydropteridine diphosphokina